MNQQAQDYTITLWTKCLCQIKRGVFSINKVKQLDHTLLFINDSTINFRMVRNNLTKFHILCDNCYKNHFYTCTRPLPHSACKAYHINSDE